MLRRLLLELEPPVRLEIGSGSLGLSLRTVPVVLLLAFALSPSESVDFTSNFIVTAVCNRTRIVNHIVAGGPSPTGLSAVFAFPPLLAGAAPHGGPIHGCSGAIDGPLQHLPARAYSKRPQEAKTSARAKLPWVGSAFLGRSLVTRYCHVKAESMEFII